MEKERSSEESIPTLKDLFPYFTDEQTKESEENLERYLDVILRIYKRINADQEDTGVGFDEIRNNW